MNGLQSPPNSFVILNRAVIVAFLGCVTAVIIAELAMGRTLFGPDARFGYWEGDIWSAANSQRMADPYSFSHICHGMLSYGVLFLIARRMSLSWRFMLSTAMECIWEIAENSPFIINRYREATISIGYEGDSVLNSSCDVIFMAVGFLLAYRMKPAVTIALFAIFEVGCLLWVRDNLTLNIIMLLHPVESIKAWQSALHSAA